LTRAWTIKPVRVVVAATRLMMVWRQMGDCHDNSHGDEAVL
jgi:hypothetical protein